jgi:hypothetical protein
LDEASYREEGNMKEIVSEIVSTYRPEEQKLL